MSYLKIPEILLPAKGVDLKKWAVVACDQFTGDGEYWKSLDEFCGEISTLRLILPEIYLSSSDVSSRIDKINKTMLKYLSDGVFEAVNGFILTVRTFPSGKKRAGIIAAIDLEAYEICGKGAIRATEQTVRERLPARIRIRRDSTLELPHALLLVDDDCGRVVKPLYNARGNMQKLYETELNMGGGKLEGYLIPDPEAVMKTIEEITSPERLVAKYGTDEPFVFAVGDGNHSIAAARAFWDELKIKLSPTERENHPARYCLVEIDDIYDDDLVFEPIHRVIFGAKSDFFDGLKFALKGNGSVGLYFDGKMQSLPAPQNTAEAIAAAQNYIDEYLSCHRDAYEDYIHGLDEAKKLADLNGAAVVVMPKLKKEELFPFVAANGALTRKSFSMGEAREKRYYFECRKIR